MKKTKVTLVIFLNLFANISCAQNKQTFLDINQVSIGKITYQSSIEDIKNILGKPLSHETHEDLDGENWDIPGKSDILYFDGFIVTFFKPEYLKKATMIDVEIKNSRYPLTVGKKSIRVGDDIKKIENILPYEYIYFKSKNIKVKQDKIYEILGGNLTYDELEPTNILFWIKNQKIIMISIGFPEP